ncbi:MAG: hypothetical protein ACYC9L_06685 [Sulfuricaulis sp.]
MFLSTVRPLLRDDSQVQLRIRGEGEGLAVTVIPQIKGIEAETNDATLAALQAALTKPFHFTIAVNEDPDKALADVLTSIGAAQAGARDDLAKYRAQIEADRVAAKQAQEKRKADADAAKAKAKAKPLKAPITKAAEPQVQTKAPAPVAAADLFSAGTPSPEAAAPAAPVPSAPVTETPASTEAGDGWGDEAGSTGEATHE